MSLKAQFTTNALGDITVHLKGGIDFENSIPLRGQLETLQTQNPTCNITIDFDTLDFVGSSGLGHFVETLKILNNKKSQIKLSNVSSDFIKVFKLYNFEALESLIVSFENDDTEDLSYKFANRKHTFEN
jgi:anti-sigma B factor antagonist